MNALPTASIREARSIPSLVSIGRNRPDLVQQASLPPRTAAQIIVDRDAAQAEREALEASRADLLVTGSVEEIAALDHRIALTKVRQDQAEAQHAATVTAEAKAKADHDAEQVRRRALRKAGMKASAEAAKLADRYLVMAKEMAALLGQLREHERVIAEANRNLPDNTDPVPPGEPDNGTPSTPSYYQTEHDVVWVNPDGSRAGITSDPKGKLIEKRVPKQVCIPGTPGIPHAPLSGRPYLPGLGPDASPIWGARHYVNGEPR